LFIRHSMFRGSVRRLAVSPRRTPEVPSYDQADEGSYRQDQQNCG
jgi:hypothetical protein